MSIQATFDVEARYPELPRSMVALLRWASCVAVVWHAGHPTLCAGDSLPKSYNLRWAPNDKRRKCVVRYDASGRPVKSFRPPMMPVCSTHYFAVRQRGAALVCQRQRLDGYSHVWWPAIQAIEALRRRPACPVCGCGAKGTCTLRWSGNEASCAAPGIEGRSACSACTLQPLDLVLLGLAIVRTT